MSNRRPELVEQYRQNAVDKRRAKEGNPFYAPYYIDKDGVRRPTKQNRTGAVIESGVKKYQVLRSGQLKRIGVDRAVRRKARHNKRAY